MIALVSACAGGLDVALPLPPHPQGVRSICYRDDTPSPDVARTWWRTLPIRFGGMEPRLAAKLFKCQIHTLDETGGAEFLVWADTCFDFSDLGFLIEWAAMSGGRRAVFVPHPDRKTVDEEYAYVIGELRRGSPYLSARYSLESFEREREMFARGHVLSALPLWAGGIWLLPNTPPAHSFLDRWWWTVTNYNVFDQCAITPLLAEAGLEVVPAELDLYLNSYWKRIPHR